MANVRAVSMSNFYGRTQDIDEDCIITSIGCGGSDGGDFNITAGSGGCNYGGEVIFVRSGSGVGSIDTNLIIDGDLTVQGTTTTIEDSEDIAEKKVLKYLEDKARLCLYQSESVDLVHSMIKDIKRIYEGAK